MGKKLQTPILSYHKSILRYFTKLHIVIYKHPIYELLEHPFSLWSQAN